MTDASAARLRATRSGRWRLLAAGLLAGGLGLTGLPAAGYAAAGPAGEDGVLQPTPGAAADYFPVGYDARAILGSARVDELAGTVTLLLHRGRLRDRRTVWYVLTDVSHRGLARRLGLNWSPKLASAPAGAVRTATRGQGGGLVFDAGYVDFGPERRVTPGAAPDFFPPAAAVAGSVGDSSYSPLVRVGGAVFNATTVANGVTASEIEFPDGGVDHTKVIDRAVAISPRNHTVTLALSTGTSGSRPVLFVSLDSNNTVVSALEATTVAPRLSRLPVGLNDAPGSAVSVNYIIANGPTGTGNPQQQGLNSALGDPGAQVLDVFDGAPGVLNGTAYSPMWDLYVAAWTPEAVAAGYRARLDSELEVLALAHRGWLTRPGGGPLGPSGLISNCPLILHY
jgi:hypothetical protein